MSNDLHIIKNESKIGVVQPEKIGQILFNLGSKYSYADT